MPKKNMVKYMHYSARVWMVTLALVLASCKTTKPSVFNNTNQYFKVSLYSIGTGIDKEALNIVNNTIDAYTKKGNHIGYTKVAWGREGEIDFCFSMFDLDTNTYQQFLNELTVLLKDKQVHINEQVPCN